MATKHNVIPKKFIETYFNMLKEIREKVGEIIDLADEQTENELYALQDSVDDLIDVIKCDLGDPEDIDDYNSYLGANSYRNDEKYN